jgi:hypothetical protein
VHQFSAEHLVVLALTAAAIVVAIKAPKALPPKVLAVVIGGIVTVTTASRTPRPHRSRS